MNRNNEIKKVLYKEKPRAEKLGSEDGFVIYGCETSLGKVTFKIPNNEATGWDVKQPAQLLIRWLHQY